MRVSDKDIRRICKEVADELHMDDETAKAVFDENAICVMKHVLLSKEPIMKV